MLGQIGTIWAPRFSCNSGLPSHSAQSCPTWLFSHSHPHSRRPHPRELPDFFLVEELQIVRVGEGDDVADAGGYEDPASVAFVGEPFLEDFSSSGRPSCTTSREGHSWCTARTHRSTRRDRSCFQSRNSGRLSWPGRSFPGRPSPEMKTTERRASLLPRSRSRIIFFSSSMPTTSESGECKTTRRCPTIFSSTYLFPSSPAERSAIPYHCFLFRVSSILSKSGWISRLNLWQPSSWPGKREQKTLPPMNPTALAGYSPPRVSSSNQVLHPVLHFLVVIPSSKKHSILWSSSRSPLTSLSTSYRNRNPWLIFFQDVPHNSSSHIRLCKILPRREGRLSFSNRGSFCDRPDEPSDAAFGVKTVL